MTDWPLIAVRWILFADLGLLFGVPLFAAYALRGDERARSLPLRAPTACLAALGLAAGLIGFLLTAAAMLGTSVGEVDRETIEALLRESSLGWAFIVRSVALVAIFMGALALRRTAALAGIILLGAIALASLAWSGHGAASEGALGGLHLASDIAHLLAAGAWIGALVAFLFLVVGTEKRDPIGAAAVHRALAGFATTGTVIVGVILLSGLVNSFILVGIDNIAALGTTLYGQLLLTKLALFVGMLALAAGNRFRLTPMLGSALAAGEPRSSLARLRGSLMLEAAAGIAILALVAWFGTLEPPSAAG